MTNEYFKEISFSGESGQLEKPEQKQETFEDKIQRLKRELDFVKYFLSEYENDNSNFEIGYYLELFYKKIKLSFLILIKEINNCDKIGCDLKEKYEEYTNLKKGLKNALKSLNNTKFRGKIEPENEVLEFLEKIEYLENLIQYKKKIGN